MFTLLRMYADDNIASMYATQMHSDSGYMVTDATVSVVSHVLRSVPNAALLWTECTSTSVCALQGKTSYGGYLTWDDHPVHRANKKKVTSHPHILSARPP